MNCRQFESNLNEILDQRGDPRLDHRLQQHAGHCPECCLILKYYSAFTELGQPPVTTKPVSTVPKTAYASLLAAAALALVLFLTFGNTGFDNEHETVNIAKAGGQNKPYFPNLQRQTANTLQITSPNFWEQPRLIRLMSVDRFPLQVPRVSDLEQVGQSINSVWTTIRKDKYLLPILKQSALFWAQ